MKDRLHLEVVTQTRRVLDVEAEEVQLPGTLGVLGVLPGHTPLLTTLGIGELMFRSDHRESYLALQWGFAEVLPDRVTVLASIAEMPEEIDVATAERERDEAEVALKTAGAVEVEVITARLQMALTRIKVAERRNG